MLVTVVSLALLIQSKVDLIILIKVGLSVFKASFFLIQYPAFKFFLQNYFLIISSRIKNAFLLFNKKAALHKLNKNVRFTSTVNE